MSYFRCLGSLRINLGYVEMNEKWILLFLASVTWLIVATLIMGNF